MSELVEFRCPTHGCGRLLCKVTDAAGVTLEVRCPRCKTTHTAELADTDTDEVQTHG